MNRPARLRPVTRRAIVALTFWAAAFAPALGYTPGSGTLFTEDFDGELDADWEQGNGIGQPSPWTQVLDGADKAFYADGYGPIFTSPTTHWARHLAHPVEATTFSIAFEYRTERGPGYVFDLDLEQRAETPRQYRLRVDADGAMGLYRTEGGAFVLMASTGPGVVPVNQKRWLRLAIEPDGSGHRWVRARLWDGGAGSEPGTWTLEFLDTLDVIERVHRFALTADGPQGTETWVDDLDVFGDGSIGVASSVRTVYLVEMSHLDIGFTEPPDDIEQFAKTHLDQVLDNLDADPDYRWTIESGWWLDRWWEQSSDTERQRMVDRLREGRLVLNAGYANLHTTAVGHEQLNRALYWTHQFALDHGIATRTWVTDDVPGSTFALPELLSRAGVEFYLGGMNTTFGGRLTAPDHGDRPFWWQGPDGSRVLAWITFDSYAEGFRYGFGFFDTLDDLYTNLGKKLPEQEEAGYDYPEMMMLRAFDNHYQGFHVRDLVEAWNATYPNPVFVLATPDEFFDHMLATYGPDAFPTFTGDFGAAWASSRANAPHTQDWIRRAHRRGRAAEALLAVAARVDGEPVPVDSLRLLYRKMLESDEHSGAGGWPEYFTPEEMDRNNRIHLGYARDARDTADSLLQQGLDRLVADLPASGDAVVVVNPLGRSRDGWVRVVLPDVLFSSSFRVVDRSTGVEEPYQSFAATKEILFRPRSVPSFGYKVFDLVPGTPQATPEGLLVATATSLENDFYLLQLDPEDGSVASLWDKKTGRELVDVGASYKFNQLATATKSQMDSGSPVTAEPPSSVTLTLETGGPMLAEIRVDYADGALAETRYRLYRGEDRVEIQNTLNRDRMAYVPLSVGVRAHTVTMPFDIHDFQLRTETPTRFLDPLADGFARTGVFDWHNAEHTMQFWDANVGVLYAVDAATVHHFENFSTLTSASFSSSDALLLTRMFDRVDEYTFEDGTVGPFAIEPDTPPDVTYVHHIRATAPAFDPQAASRFGFESLSPLEARLLDRRPGNLPDAAASFVRAEGDPVLPYALKTAERDGRLVLRLTELSGTPASVHITSDVFTFGTAERLETDEDAGSPLAADPSGFWVDLGAYETATAAFEASPSWSPIVLTVDKDAASGSVRLDWTGGVSPYTLKRAEDPPFAVNPTVLVDEAPVQTHLDPVLQDGQTYYYLVR